MQASVARGFVVRRFEGRSVPALLANSAARFPQRRFLRVVDPAAPQHAPEEITFAGFAARVRAAAGFLRSRGVGPGERVLLLSENSPDWQVFAIAAQALRAEPVALFANLDPLPAQDAARRAGARVAFVSGPAQWAKIAPAAEGLRCVVAPQKLEASIESVTIEEALRAPGLDLDDLARAVTPQDPFLLLFTSGTTGRNKGVRVAQGGFLRAVEAGWALTAATPEDDALMFLPYAHIAGQALFHTALGVGHGLIHVARRDDIQRGFELGPTYVLSVPLIYERIAASFEEQLAQKPGPVRKLVGAALEAAARVRCDGSTSALDGLLCRLSDALVGKKLRAKLGGRLRALFAGAAPTPPSLFRFFESLGIGYVEIYGMSETSAFIAGNRISDRRVSGSVGRPSEDVEIALDDDGEICIRGPMLMTGYLEKWDEQGCYTPEGYFRTGDLGEWDAEGRLRIVGRKKNLFVLSTGKKVSPEPIELAMCSGPPIHGAILCGDGCAFLCVGVFVPLTELQRLGTSVEDALLSVVRDRLSAFSEHEKPKRLFAIAGAPQDHAHILTPTFKVKRQAFLDWRRDDLTRIYQG